MGVGHRERLVELPLDGIEVKATNTKDKVNLQVWTVWKWGISVNVNTGTGRHSDGL